jgi:hypothetical protein
MADDDDDDDVRAVSWGSSQPSTPASSPAHSEHGDGDGHVPSTCRREHGSPIAPGASSDDELHGLIQFLAMEKKSLVAYRESEIAGRRICERLGVSPDRVGKAAISAALETMQTKHLNRQLPDIYDRVVAKVEQLTAELSLPSSPT